MPAGAIPKDGPSAGVAMFSALVSLMTNRTVRNDTAMTGEISLPGLVLPVGGIKKKTAAAARAGLARVLLPARDRKDLEDISEEVRRKLEFVFLSNAWMMPLPPRSRRKATPAPREKIRHCETRSAIAVQGRIQRVAAACGFGNVKAICRALLRHVGTGPNEYRRRFRYRRNGTWNDAAENNRHLRQVICLVFPEDALAVLSRLS